MSYATDFSKLTVSCIQAAIKAADEQKRPLLSFASKQGAPVRFNLSKAKAKKQGDNTPVVQVKYYQIYIILANGERQPLGIKVTEPTQLPYNLKSPTERKYSKDDIHLPLEGVLGTVIRRLVAEYDRILEELRANDKSVRTATLRPIIVDETASGETVDNPFVRVALPMIPSKCRTFLIKKQNNTPTLVDITSDVTLENRYTYFRRKSIFIGNIDMSTMTVSGAGVKQQMEFREIAIKVPEPQTSNLLTDISQDALLAMCTADSEQTDDIDEHDVQEKQQDDEKTNDQLAELENMTL